MVRSALLALAALCLLDSGCTGAEPPVTEPESAPATEGGPMFASAAEDIVMETAPGAPELTFTPPPASPDPTPLTAARGGGSGPPNPEGGGRTISAAEVKSVVSAKTPQVRACYERELKAREGLRGKVVMGWTVGADGRVSGARVVSNGTRNSEMLPCMIRAVSNWTFPRAEASFDVEYPFTFKPRDQ